MRKRIAILGDGGWGAALALVLNENGHGVTVWGPFPDVIEQIKAAGENAAYLPDVPMPRSISWTADRAEAARGADAVVLASPTRYFRDVLNSFAALIPRDARVVTVAKGFDEKSGKRMSEVANDMLGRSDVCALSGPSLAPEVARRTPTAVALASPDDEACFELRQIFSNNRFRVYTSRDIAGVELGGALKNVMALAVGVSDGLGFGDNTRAALITRGLAEMTRLGAALGAQRATFSGLSGMGDLIVTCTSRWSRNRSVGERLGKGEKIADILTGMKQAAEGVWNCPIARDLAREMNVEVPIINEVYAILREGKSSSDAVAALLARELKPEN
ncbi:MAG: NAD(P)H-dependent glycerol-3-phosphate dehydrogenase [Verrucomicrobiota bacterium]|nr:NAD(P)H-dependent glycerol-3-phosphate dehydrogenase [Verrucomicrobiota bacterium]